MQRLRDDRVLPATRVISVFIIPFLVVAFVVLYPWPSDAGRLFAWKIAPSVTAMMLGAVYLGGAYFFLRAARATRWHTVKGGFVSVGVFASLMGIATILHWDRFAHGHVAFWLWAGLYFTTPFLIFGVWFANRGHDAAATDADLLLPPAATPVIGGLGILALVTSAFLFLFPARAISVWPWTVTPLTARVLGAIFSLGIAGIGIFADRRWSSARILLQVAALMLLLILAAALRSHADFDAGNVLTWAFAVGFLAAASGIGGLYIAMESRARAGS